MPYPSETFIGAFSSALQVVGDELRHFYAQLIGYLNIEHDEDGHHTAITADSVTVAGDLTIEGDGTFDGTVTADADGNPVTIGPVGPLDLPGIRLRAPAAPTATDNDWMLWTGSGSAPRTLFLSDVLEAGDIALLEIARTGPSSYELRPHSSAITLTVTASVYAGGETGTWTPVDASGAGLTFTSAGGEYTKLCDTVFFTFQVIYPATASGAAAIIGGLPFAANANNHVASQGYGVPFLQWLVQGTSIAPLTTATSANVTNAALTGADFVVSGFYKV